MKAIFLDIDGVVCLHSAKTPNDEEIFDADSCRRLKEIIDATGCKLVLTSSWRLYSESIRSMFFQFKKYGIYKEHFLGKTPLCGERGDEIMVYLKSHPQIVTYVALDDQPFYRSKFPNDRLILTHANVCKGQTQRNGYIVLLWIEAGCISLKIHELRRWSVGDNCT